MTRKRETKAEKAQRLEDARVAAAKALFDEFERWNDRGFLTAEKPIRCSTHDSEDCTVCGAGRTRKRK